MPTPFWKPVLRYPGVPDPTEEELRAVIERGALGRRAEGPPQVIVSEQSAGAWEKPLWDGKALPGLVRLVKEPDLKLKENFSKADGRDTQVRKILGLESPDFAFECTILTADHLADLDAQMDRLLPVERANGRGEVKGIVYPLVNQMRIHFAYVFHLHPEGPKGGSPEKMTIYFRPFWPHATEKKKGNTNKTLNYSKPVATIPIAQQTPAVPRLSDLVPNRPTPGRNQ